MFWEWLRRVSVTKWLRVIEKEQKRLLASSYKIMIQVNDDRVVVTQRVLRLLSTVTF